MKEQDEGREEKEYDFELTDDEQPEDLDSAQKRGSSIALIISGIALVVFVVALLMLANIFLGYRKADKEYENIEEQVFGGEIMTDAGGDSDNQETKADVQTAEAETEEETLGPFTYNHEALLELNSEGVGYIYLPAIAVRLPIAQTDNNDYYLDHTFTGKSNSSGTLFVDSAITDGLDGSNVIIYGHNMRNGGMFAKLLYYRNESFYRNAGSDVFYIYTGDEVRSYQIFAVYECDEDAQTYTCNFPNAAQLQEYAEGMKAASLYDTGVDVSNASQVVTLSTCTSDGKRRVVVQGVRQ
jgi:sortase B